MCMLLNSRTKFSVKVASYMMELYNDKLIDLYAKPGTSDDVSISKHLLQVEPIHTPLDLKIII